MRLSGIVKRLLLATVLLGVMLATAGSAGAATGGIYYVNASPPAGSDGSCSSWANACADLQTALSKAQSGYQIWVAAGTYKPTATTDRSVSFVMKDGVAIYGGFPNDGTGALTNRNWTANETILSGDLGNNDGANFANRSDNAYRVVTVPGTVSSTGVLDGFTIRGGYNSTGASPYGGGISNEGSPTLANLIVTGNWDNYIGGGMDVNNGSPSLNNVTFSANSTGSEGGGMAIYGSGSPSLTNVTFNGNSASSGGGVRLANDGSPSFTNVTFNDNTAYSGGGVYVYYSGSGTPSFTSVTFSGNSATSGNGGGMYVDGAQGPATASLTNAVFRANTYSSSGGGIYLYNGNASATLTNATFYGNRGVNGGSYNAIYSNGGTVTIANSILWNTSSSALDPVIGSGSISASYSLVQKPSGDTTPYTGTGNIYAPDPLFVDATGGDLHLSAGSPAIDAGNNAAVPAGVTTDLGGAPRFKDDTGTPDTGSGTPPIVDMGAYEFQGTTTSSPDLTITENHSGSFVQGQTGAQYTITVTNSGAAATSSTVTVTDTLPAGLTATAMSGTGWTCPTGFPATLTCTRSDALAVSASYPAITLTVNVATNAAASLTNTATVSGGGETNTSNDTATDPTSITAGNNPPSAPTAPNPADGATGVAATATLSWAASTDPDAGDTVTYQVYLDTSSNPSTSVCSGLSTPSCDPTPTGDLAPSTTYYWKVVATDSHSASTGGPVWSFTTGAALPTIISQPRSQRVVVGQTATFAASATGFTSVHWEVSTNNGASWSDVPGATGTTLSFRAAISQDGNRYRAVFADDAGSAATNAASLTVGEANTTTLLTSNANPSMDGVTFTARVGAASPGAGTPTGTVTFLDGRTVLSTKSLDASGAATSDSVSLSVGTHSITARYSGDASFNASTSNTVSQVVNPPTADIAVDITNGTYDSGSNTITWTVAVTNNGTGTAKAVVVTDTLPKGTKLTSIGGLGTGSYRAHGSAVSIALGDLAYSGSPVTITLTIDTSLNKQPAPGTAFVNTASVSTASTDPNSGNNSDSYTLNIP